MASLLEIQKRYCNDIVTFFCEQYCEMLKYEFDKDKGEDLRGLINNQIVTRLYDARLIRNYKVDVLIFPKAERRGIKIENLLEDKNVDSTYIITVYLEYTDLTICIIEHKIVKP